MKTNRKGFTITELVIVIVVIAILAAVLIPTFSSLIKKANISADTQMAKNLNTALTMAEASGEEIDEFGEALNAMREAGYLLANLNPTTQGCYLVWESETNQILLVDGEKDYEVIYAVEKDYPAIGETWYFAIADRAAAAELKADLEAKNYAANVPDMYANVEDFSAALAAGGEQTMYVDESVVLDSTNVLKVDKADADITIELGNASLTTDGTIDDIPVFVDAGKLTIVGGNIGGAGSFTNEHGSFETAVAADKGDLTLNNVVITATGSGVTHGAVNDDPDTKVEINNCTITAGTCINLGGTGEVTINNVVAKATAQALFLTWYTEATINGGEFSSTGNSCLRVYGYDSTLTITGGSFSGGDVLLKIGEGTTGTATVIITGGTFNGKTFAELDTLEEWQALCNSGVTITGVGTNTVTITG